MKNKALLAAILLSSFTASYAKPDVFKVVSHRSLAAVAPLTCLSVDSATFSPSGSGTIYYGTVTLNLLNNCNQEDIPKGVFIDLAIKSAADPDKNIMPFFAGNTTHQSIQFNNMEPWLPNYSNDTDLVYPNLFESSQVFLSLHPHTNLSLTFGLNFFTASGGGIADSVDNENKIVNYFENSALKAYSLEDVPINLDIFDGAKPSNYDLVVPATGPVYPTIELQKKNGANWTSIESRTFSGWDQDWSIRGLLFGEYRVVPQELDLASGAKFTTTNRVADEFFFPQKNYQARFPYAQSTDANGEITVTLPSQPGGAPSTVIVKIEDNSGNVLSTKHLQWGSNTVTNLAPGRDYKFAADPIFYVDSDAIKKFTFTDSTAVEAKSTELNSTSVGGSSTDIDSQIVTFTLSATPPAQKTVPEGTTVNAVITADIDGAPRTYSQSIPFDGEAHDVVVAASPATSFYKLENVPITYDGNPGLYIPDTSSGTVSASNTINYSFDYLPKVAGWDATRISMGNLTADGGITGEGLASRSSAIDAIFKYAGSNGGGDRGLLQYPEWTGYTADEAQQLSSTTKHVVPVMVAYTAQMSGGTNFADIDNQANIEKHLANLAMTAFVLKNKVDASSSKLTSGSIVLNPDLIGMIAQNKLQAQIAAAMSAASPAINIGTAVARALCVIAQNPTDQASYEAAFDSSTCEAKTAADLPANIEFTNDFAGWVAANNYIVHTAGNNKVTYGWVMNLWSANPATPNEHCASGSATWVHHITTTDATDRATQVQACYSTNNESVLNQYNFYDTNGEAPNKSPSNPKPQYIAFDKYEADVIPAALGLGYLFNQSDWENYYLALQQISNYLDNVKGLPVMVFQLPGGHIRTEDDVDTRPGNISTAPDYIFGNNALKADFSGAVNVPGVSTGYLTLAIADQTYNCGDNCTVESYLSANNQNWTLTHLKTLLDSHVFAILWGGGTGPTTSIASYPTNDGGWLYQHILDYISEQTGNQASSCSAKKGA